MKLGLQRNYHRGWVALRYYANHNQPIRPLSLMTFALGCQFHIFFCLTESVRLMPVYHSVLNVEAFNQEKGRSPCLYNIAVSSFAALARSLHMPLSRAPPSLSRDLDTGGCAHSVYRDTLPGSDAGSAAGHSVQCPSLL